MMTIKESIQSTVLDMPLVTCPSKKEISEYEKGIENLNELIEDILDQFARWVNERESDAVYNLDWYCRNNKMHEMLEIFKKEKEL